MSPKPKPVSPDQFEAINGVAIENIDEKLFKVVGTKETETESIAVKPYSYWKAVVRLLITNVTFLICTALLVMIVLLAIIVPWGKQPIPVHRPGAVPEMPTWQHLFGLGIRGEDFWVEIWSGMRITLLFAFIITFIQLFVGIILGSIWGYFRKSDVFFVQITNFLTLVPQLILLLFMIFIFENGMWPIILGVSLQAWIQIASTIRVQIMLVRSHDYNIASINLGSSSRHIIQKNILPKILPVIVQAGIFAIPNAIGVDSALTFLNFGFVDGFKRTSLGKVLNDVMATTDWQVYPHLIIIPIVIISAVSILFFLVAKVFADSLDPKNHR